MIYSMLLQTILCGLVGVKIVKTGPVIISSKINNTKCSEVSKTELSQILGPSLNPRYMSITPPQVSEETREKEDRKRKAEELPPSFFVQENFTQELSNEPAWNQNNINEILHRNKRSSKTSRQWECESKLNWIDLGQDYFPRYLRSVECVSKICWYGHFKCKPRSFTLKLLRRKRNECVLAKSGNKIGVDGLPAELRQLWVWEERAVNFCCHCSV